MTNFPNEFNELLREVQAVKRQIGHASDKLDDLTERVRALVKQEANASSLRLAPADTTGPVAAVVDRRDQEPLVKFVMLERLLDGGYLVQIGEEEPVSIPKSLALLLAALAGGAGDYVIANDPFVGWKSWESLAEKLGLSNRHAVSGRIHRLRRLLKRSGVDANLVQTSPTMGGRFGLSRKGSLVIEDDTP